MEKDNFEKLNRIERLKDIERSARKACLSALAFVGFVTISLTLADEYVDVVDRNPTQQEWVDSTFQDCFDDSQRMFELVVSSAVAKREAEDMCLEEVFPK